ncbi:MAG TPA: glyoxylate/hydroxypyruvate reductase A [Gemmataceae bacterium]|nr:glyoxylate/hydroxypyruvate reductase A [Gemmataceae bacterium]
MALALVSKFENPDLWRRTMAAEIPGVDVRVWPNLGDTAEIRMAAFESNLAPPGIFATMPNLGCIVFLGHGANDFLQRPDLPTGVPVMRLKDPGIISFMTEYVLLYILSHHLFQATYRRYQAERRWQEHIPPFPGDVRIAVLGLGSIGQRVAEALVNFGYKVNGWSRGPHQLPGIAGYRGRDQLAGCLAPCDYVVCILPETTETRDIIDAETLASMKRGAYFINVGRGKLVVEEDLLAALDSGQLSGATLDVFRTEPLPADSRLWTHPNVAVTPHVAGGALHGSLAYIAENYRRLLDGRPLINIVDPSRGY